MKVHHIPALAMIAFSFVSMASVSQAQTAPASGPQALITWKAVDSLTPVGYQGKALPGANSKMVASVEVIAGGGLASLKSRTIYWYLDGSYIGGGIGRQTITFPAAGYVETMALRVNIPDYPGGTLIYTQLIQMAKPQAVIVAPYPSGNFSQSPVQVHADPYFFKASGVDSLSFQWSVNGQVVTTQENPENLVITLGNDVAAGYALSVDLIVQQGNDVLNAARPRTVLTKSN
jgi:hypothetical protein